ncbi:MAG: insulinase family protein, partial [Lysobacterales bacterium]
MPECPRSTCTTRVRAAAVFCAWLALVPGVAMAYLDLASAAVERLDNGMTVLVLEEPAFPVVSVQMLYKVGAVQEPAGKTGLAHFLEHMAFRDTENFADTDVVSSIYAAGGEWHGYTWLDQTTYFATVPRDRLDLLLRIEADRMARLLIPEADVAAETGAVLSEMHGYENDPATVLQDYVMYTSFLAHPYRNNTIGWEGDVKSVTHADLVDFYRRYYHPGNAVLAVVGDVDKAEVMRLVARLFDGIAGRPPAARPHTAEPEQKGERRVRLHGDIGNKSFKIAFHAPPAASRDYAPFLVLQELLGGGSGVSFLQNDWGTPARAGRPLFGITPDIATWYPPSADSYVFTIGGTADMEADETAIETGIRAAIEALLEDLEAGDAETGQKLEAAREAVLSELAFDVETTEDAAHQLAYFEGIGARRAQLALPGAVKNVTASDVARQIRTYLGPEKQTVGWYVPAGKASPTSVPVAGANERSGSPSPPPPAGDLVRVAERAAPPLQEHLSNGTTVIVQRSPLSRTARLELVVPGIWSLPGAETEHDTPVWGVTSASFDWQPGQLGSTALAARQAIDSAEAVPAQPPESAVGAQALLDRAYRDILGLAHTGQPETAAPLLVVVTGDIDPDEALKQVDSALGELPTAAVATPPALNEHLPMNVEISAAMPLAQEQLAYVVPAPRPGEADAAAWQMALYILSHGYEGRLGKQAISRRGLVYYIDSEYHTDGA